MKLRDVVVLGGVGALSLGFLVPLRAHCQDTKDTRIACSNNLKQLGLAAIQYADDKRFFPHLEKLSKLDHGGDTTPTGNDVPGRCLRSLIYFNYCDNPEVFVCPSSDDKAGKLSEAAKRDIHVFGWLGADSDDPKASPIAAPMKEDKDADKLTDLSYGWTVRGLSSNSQSSLKMLADRGARIGPRTKQTIKGDHKKGWNVATVDCHVEFVKKGSDEATTLSATDKKKDGYLVVWDEKNAGDKKADDKKDDEDK